MIDLDALRALCKSDVRTQRAILANRRAHEDLDRELRHLQSKPLMRGSLEEKELEARKQLLNARFEELLCPNKDDNDDEEREDFDAEAEFERVMGSTVLKPHIPGELGDVDDGRSEEVVRREVVVLHPDGEGREAVHIELVELEPVRVEVLLDDGRLALYMNHDTIYTP